MQPEPFGSKTPGLGGFVFMGRRLSALLPFLVLLAIGWCYRSTFGFDYVWDDRAFFLISTDLREGKFLSVISAPVLAGTAYFRPLVMASFVGELRWAGGDPYWSHVVNVAIHLVNTALVGLLAFRLRRSFDPRRAAGWIVATLAMTFFGFHPALIESVAWISGRFDLMVTTFSLIALLLLSSSSRTAVWLGGLAFFTALLCKEMAVTLPVVLFLLLWALRRPDSSLREAVVASLRPPQLWPYLALVAAGLAYLGLRFFSIGAALRNDPTLTALLASPLIHAGFIGKTFAFYIKTIIWPFMGMGPLHPVDVASIGSAEAAGAAAFLLLCLGFVAFSLWRPTRVRLLASAVLVSLLPVANIVPLMIVGNIGHERFLVLPLALAALAVASVDTSRWQVSAMLRSRLPLLGGLAFVAWTAVSVMNLQVTLPLWRNDLSLWSWAYAQNPDAPFAQYSLAGAALRSRDNDIAREVITRAEKNGPLPLRLMVPYGQYLIRTGQPQAGVDKVTEALSKEILPHREVEAAGLELEDAMLHRQTFPGWTLIYAYITLAEGHNALRQFKEAEHDAKIASFYQRDNPVPQLYRSFAIYGQDRWTDGEAAFQKARTMYVAAVQPEADIIRESFLRQLCTKPEETPAVCRQVSRIFKP